VTGFVKIRRGILDHLLSGIISIFEFGIYVILHLQADYRTGVWTGSAPRLRAAAPRGARKRDLQRALQRLGEIGFIRIFRIPGKRGNYHVLIHKFESTDTALSGKRLNAFKSSSWEELVFEACTDDDTDGTDNDTDTATDGDSDGALKGKQLNASKSSGSQAPASGACADSATDSCTDARTDTARYQEEEREEEKEKSLNPSRSRSRSRPNADADPLFQKFWSDYPRKIRKRESYAAWCSLSAPDRIAAVEALVSFKASSQWRKENGEYIPSPHRFLSDRRFENPPVERKNNAAGSGTRKNHGVHSGRDTDYNARRVDLPEL
jgi:hypothetical protein